MLTLHPRLREALWVVSLILLLIAALAAHGTNVHISWNVSLCLGLAAALAALKPAP